MTSRGDLRRPTPLLALALALLARAAPAAAPSPPPEPPAPQPTLAVQKLFEPVNQLLHAGKLQEALASVEEALAAARQADDRPGEARAYRAHAFLLQSLGRNDAALAAWREAAQAWERAGDGPGQIEALALEVMLLTPTQPSEARAVRDRALALGRAETRRPRAAADALYVAGRVAYPQRRLEDADAYWEAALQIQEKQTPDSLPLASTLDALAVVAFDRGDLTGARQFDRRALVIREKLAPDSLDLSQSLDSLGNVAAAAGDLPAAGEYYQRALAIRQRLAPGSPELAGTLDHLGSLLFQQGDLAGARRHYQQALEIFQHQGSDPLDVSVGLHNLGNVAFQQGDLAGARQFFQQALAIREKLAPRSLDVATTLNDLGNVTREQGDLPEARRSFEQALAIFEKLAPASLNMAASLSNLGGIAADQGDLAGARRYYQRALSISTKLSPNSLEVARDLDNLGNVAGDQGDLAGARQYYEQSRTIQQQQAPGSLEVAFSLSGLGNVAYRQGDLAEAWQDHQQALSIRERLAPGSKSIAASLTALGMVAKDEGDPALAGQYYRQALAIQQQLAPGSLDVAYTWNDLGTAAQAGNDRAGARRCYQQALSIFDRLVPGSLTAGLTLVNLATVLDHHRDLAVARSYSQRALAILEKQAPGSLEVAFGLETLGNIAAEERRWPEAAAHFGQAWAIAGRQAGAARGDEARQAFDTSTARYAGDLARAQLALRQPQAAFRTLEEARAQALRQQLLQRQLSPRGVDPRRWAAYRQALAARDQAELALSRAFDAAARAEQQLHSAPAPPARSAADAESQVAVTAAGEALGSAYRRYLRARDDAAQRWIAIERSAPRLFAPPLSLAQAARRLPTGTLFLGFALGEPRSVLFLLHSRGGRPDLQVFPLPVGVRALQTRIVSLRRDLSHSGALPTAASHALFTALFPPAARRGLATARRLLISPDGPLWELPFAALVADPHGPRYLGEQFPLTYTPSLTLFAQLRQAPALHPVPRLALVAAPFATGSPAALAALPAGTTEEGGERGLLLRIGGEPRPLPESGPEAVQIARLYHTAPLLGPAATEAAVRRKIGRAAIVHLATHGYLQLYRAMDSGILLAAPAGAREGRDDRTDGALQAWEIAGQLRLRADLVVLSACETGLGQNVQSEGVVGLVRALEIAGARSVVASQWSVADPSTAKLMVAFHEKLRAGLPKDEALREAMTQVRRDPATAHPFYWAPFFLTGDPENHALAGARPSASRHRRHRRLSATVLPARRAFAERRWNGRS